MSVIECKNLGLQEAGPVVLPEKLAPRDTSARLFLLGFLALPFDKSSLTSLLCHLPQHLYACIIKTVKVPQILKVLQAGSAKGLSYVATILELLATTFTCTYNYSKGFSFRQVAMCIIQWNLFIKDTLGPAVPYIRCSTYDAFFHLRGE